MNIWSQADERNCVSVNKPVLIKGNSAAIWPWDLLHVIWITLKRHSNDLPIQSYFFSHLFFFSACLEKWRKKRRNQTKPKTYCFMDVYKTNKLLYMLILMVYTCKNSAFLAIDLCLKLKLFFFLVINCHKVTVVHSFQIQRLWIASIAEASGQLRYLQSHFWLFYHQEHGSVHLNVSKY